MAENSGVSAAASTLRGRRIVLGKRARRQASVVLEEAASAGDYGAVAALCVCADTAKTANGKQLAQTALTRAAASSSPCRNVLLQLADGTEPTRAAATATLETILRGE